MFQKHKDGNIAFMMMLCIAIILAVGMMASIISESYSKLSLLSKSYQTSLNSASLVDITAEKFIDTLNNRELKQGSNVFTQQDLLDIQAKTKEALKTLPGIQRVDGLEKRISEIELNSEELSSKQEEVELLTTNVKIDGLEELSITLNNTWNIRLTNISLNERQEEITVGYSEEDGLPIIEYITYYKIQLDKCKINIEKVKQQ